jgi:UDP-N-acetylglucosamine 2-epimerase (non-hydrolysing)
VTEKITVMTIVGTRPEIIRLSRVIALLDQQTEHVLVHTGQNYDYELNDIFFQELHLRSPDHVLASAGSTPAQTIGTLLTQIDPVLERERPEAVLILGDTNSCFAAYAAKRRKIPIFHMEAGNRCFDFRVPEEINRRVVDHIADVNLTYSELARQYLLREGLRPDLVIRTGSPMREVLEYYMPSIERSDILSKLTLERQRYFLVSVHREEHVDDETTLQNVVSLLDALANRYGIRLIVSTHPRTRKRLEALGIKFHPLVELHVPFGYLDYIKLQVEALVVLSDSGTITEESSILNFPALNLRDSHERPEGMEEGAVMMTGMDVDRVVQGITVLMSQGRGQQRLLRLVRDYEANNVSQKVLRVIISYTDYVNRVIWQK